MARIGVISISDGRDYVHGDVVEFVRTTEKRLVQALTKAGHEVVTGRDPVWTNEMATSVAREVAASAPDLTVFHYAVWAFPHFSMLAAGATPGPLLLLSNIDPQYPGMVGMLAAGGALDQIGRAHRRLWGDLGDPGWWRDRRAGAGRRRGRRAARVDVRPHRRPPDGHVHRGRRTPTSGSACSASTSRRSTSGRSSAAPSWPTRPRRTRPGASGWSATATVHYDGDRLTPELLERQVRSYLRDAGADRRVAPRLLRHQGPAGADPALRHDGRRRGVPQRPVRLGRAEGAARLRDRGRHGRRADDAAAQAGLAGTPVLFADVRHYHADRDVWDLCNSGQHATWFAARSDDPAENLRAASTSTRRCSTSRPAAPRCTTWRRPAEMTFARLTRTDGRYRMQLMPGEFEYLRRRDERGADARSRRCEWPHAFARLDAPAEDFLARFGANHIHAVPGDHARRAARRLRAARRRAGRVRPAR